MKTRIRSCFAAAIAVVMVFSCNAQALAGQVEHEAEAAAVVASDRLAAEAAMTAALSAGSASEDPAAASSAGSAAEDPAAASSAGSASEDPAAASSADSAAEDPAAVSSSDSAAEDLAAVISDADADTDVTVSRIRFAKSEQEIFDALEKIQWSDWYDYDIAFEADGATAPNFGAAAAASETAPSASYSETNVRTEGVDEADVVKTDGQYIYILSGQSDLKIVQADGAELKQVSEIHLTVDSDWSRYGSGVREFFVSGDRLHILIQERTDDAERYRGEIAYDAYDYGTEYTVTKVATYDIADRRNPVLAGEMEQEGFYLQSRINDGKLYLFTEYYPVLGSSLENSDLTVRVGGEEVPVEQICIPDIVPHADYLVMSSLDPEKPYEACDSKVLVSGASQLYVSEGGIYAINVDNYSSRTKTEIVKFTYGDGQITGKASGTVRGTVNDTFSIDEYDGNLRVLTTYTGTVRGEFWEAVADILGFSYGSRNRWTQHNALYILDENMRRLGRIVDLAEGEEIKSARFLGETGYFVTFRNTDPLFSVDLANPASPKVLGALKIPGFSAYLHPMGEGVMVGMGYDADESTGTTTGLKLSLFDMEDPSDVREAGRTTIAGITDCPAIENYKCVFADTARGLVGFYVNDHYMLYRVNGSKFERALLYDFYEDSLQGTESYNTVRGLYIGDTFYVAGGAFVAAFDMEHDFEKVNTLSLT